MQVTCPDCGKVYDDARRWTICPHFDLSKSAQGDWVTIFEFSVHEKLAREKVEDLQRLLRDEEIEYRHSVDDNPASFGKHIVQVAEKFEDRARAIVAYVRGETSKLLGPDDRDFVDPDALLEAAWGIIANANGGNWEDARPEWKEAAEKWREKYHAFLKIPGPVMQTWTRSLTYMQQGVLVAAVRGPDGLKKDHVAKVLCRWLRRCFLVSAFEGGDFINPYVPGGGSFTGPCVWKDENGKPSIDAAVDEYFRHVDEVPHHFHLHLMHAAEILGYKYPMAETRKWWHKLYLRLVNDMHLQPEPEAVMDKRLGDNEQNWRAAEEVTAR